MVDTSQLQQQAQRVSQRQQELAGMTRAGAGLSEQLREAVADRFQSSPLYSAREQAAQQVLTSPTRAREYVSNIQEQGQPLSPIQQESIIAARRAADVVPLMTLNDLLRAREGTIEQAIQGGLTGFQSLLSSAQQQAQAEQNLLSNLLSIESQQREAEALSTLDLNDRVVVMDRFGNIIQEIPKGATPTSGTAGITAEEWLEAERAASGQAGLQATTPAPTYTPSSGEGTVSDDGQWIFSGGRWIVNPNPTAKTNVDWSQFGLDLEEDRQIGQSANLRYEGF